MSVGVVGIPAGQPLEADDGKVDRPDTLREADRAAAGLGMGDRGTAGPASHDVGDDARRPATRGARRIPRALWPVARRKLKMLDVAHRLIDLSSPPGNRLAALSGGLRGRHSIRVNDQYRLTFRWEGNHAYEVRCEDHHA